MPDFNVPDGGTIYAQPLVVPDVPLLGGPKRTVLLVATSKNMLYVYDVESVNRDPVVTFGPFGTPPFLPQIPGSANPSACSNISEAGIISTPVVDAAASNVFLVAERTTNTPDVVEHVLVRASLTAGPGSEVFQVVRPDGTRGPYPFSWTPKTHIQRPGLLLQNGAVFIAFSSSCDIPDYQGWVVAHSATTLQPLAQWCSTCGYPAPGRGAGGIWQSGAGIATDGTSIYVNTGNGDIRFAPNGDPATGDPANPGTDLSLSLVKLDISNIARGNMRPTGSFTAGDGLGDPRNPAPGTTAFLNANDLDFAVSGIAVLQGGLALSGSKEGKLYLARTDALSGTVTLPNPSVVASIQASCTHYDDCYPTPNPVTQPENCQGAKQPDALATGTCRAVQWMWPHIHGTPIYWQARDFVYAWGQRDYLRRFHINRPAFAFDVPDSVNPPRGLELDTLFGFGGILSLSVNSRSAPAPGNGTAIVWASSVLKDCHDFLPDANCVGRDTRYHKGEFSTGVLRAYDADTMRLLFSNENDTPYAWSKFVPPTIYGGRVFLATNSGQILVYGVDNSDTDGDRVADIEDNCPAVYNPDQADTNFEAERKLACGLPCNDPTKDGHRPTAFDTQQTADFFHANYPGDACDPVPTTLLNVQNAQVTQEVPCVICNTGTAQNGWVGSCHTDVGHFCSAMTTTGMTFDSWAIAAGTGTSSPAACDCPTSQISSTDDPRHEAVRKCEQFSRCTLGVDTLFPLAPNVSNPFWRSTTLSGAPYEVPMVHQRPDTAGFVAKTQSFIWDYATDKGNFTFPTGQVQVSLWGRVDTFASSGGGGCFPNCGGPNPFLKHNYLFTKPGYFPDHIRMQFPEPPTPQPPQPPDWNGFAWSPSYVPGQAPSWIAFAFINGKAFPFTQLGDTIDAQGTQFSPDALALLAPVGQNRAELLVGDDVAWGVPFQQSAISAVVALPGTTTLLGGLETAGGALVSVHKCGAASGLCDPPGPPPVLRSLLSRDGLLFALSADHSGATLTKIDVPSALANAPLASSFALTGAVPIRPIAMAWHFIERSFYVLDVVPTGRKEALRLLRVGLTGASFEMWRTKPVGHVPRAFVSVGAQGEVILSLGDAELSEIAVVDAETGAPILSRSFDAPLMKAAIGTMGGISVPLARRAHGTTSNLRLEFFTRTQAERGLCGAPWLLRHANEATRDPLGLAARGCDDEEDRHEGSRGEGQ